jgi:hypothetical protein
MRGELQTWAAAMVVRNEDGEGMWNGLASSVMFSAVVMLDVVPSEVGSCSTSSDLAGTTLNCH